MSEHIILRFDLVNALIGKSPLNSTYNGVDHESSWISATYYE